MRSSRQWARPARATSRIATDDGDHSTDPGEIGPSFHHEMRRVTAAISVLCVLLVGGAMAIAEPESFRGVRWGASEKQLRSTLGGPERTGHEIDFCYTIPPEDRQLGDRACTGRFILGGIAVQAIYGFRADNFVSVALNYRSQDFERIVAVFIERYGAPTSEERPPFRSLDGFKTTNRILRWSGPVIAIVLRRYAVETTDGLGSIATQDELREAHRIFREQTRGGAKDR